MKKHVFILLSGIAMSGCANREVANTYPYGYTYDVTPAPLGTEMTTPLSAVSAYPVTTATSDPVLPIGESYFSEYSKRKAIYIPERIAYQPVSITTTAPVRPSPSASASVNAEENPSTKITTTTEIQTTPKSPEAAGSKNVTPQITNSATATLQAPEKGETAIVPNPAPVAPPGNP